MKKLLSVLGAIALTGSIATSVVACGPNKNEGEEIKQDVWTVEDVKEQFGNLTWENSDENSNVLVSDKMDLQMAGSILDPTFQKNIVIQDGEMAFLPKNILPNPTNENRKEWELMSAVSFDKFEDGDNQKLFNEMFNGKYTATRQIAAIRHDFGGNWRVNFLDFELDSFNTAGEKKTLYVKIMFTNFFDGFIVDQILNKFTEKFSQMYPDSSKEASLIKPKIVKGEEIGYSFEVNFGVDESRFIREPMDELVSEFKENDLYWEIDFYLDPNYSFEQFTLDFDTDWSEEYTYEIQSIFKIEYLKK